MVAEGRFSFVAKKLVIVESPAKARTVGRFLGKDYVVKASIGHIRDLPKNRLGVDVDERLRAHATSSPRRRRRSSRSSRPRRKRRRRDLPGHRPRPRGRGHLLAPDRGARPSEAEAKPGPPRRVPRDHPRGDRATPSQHPREIDMKLVDAQQARRILDRLVGYKLSPLLRSKITQEGPLGRPRAVGRGAAGRRARARDRGVRAGRSTGRIEAELAKQRRGGRRHAVFVAALPPGRRREGRPEERATRPDDDRGAPRRRDRSSSPRSAGARSQRNPAGALHHQHPAAGGLAQARLHRQADDGRRPAALRGRGRRARGTVGLITYMRTDSTNVAGVGPGARRASSSRERYRRRITSRRSRAVYKTKRKGAQEAHEAIRPTSVVREPGRAQGRSSTADQYKLYRPDLAALRRQPDGRGRVRRDLGGHRRRAAPREPAHGVDRTRSHPVPRQRLDRQVPGLHGRLRRGPATRASAEEEDEESKNRRCRRSGAGRGRSTWSGCSRSSTSPSRRRATPRPRW